MPGDTTPLGTIAGSLAAALLAMDFVTEPETWPVFAAWVQRKQPAEAAGFAGETMRNQIIVRMGYLDQVFKVAQQQRRGQGGG